MSDIFSRVPYRLRHIELFHIPVAGIGVDAKVRGIDTLCYLQGLSDCIDEIRLEPVDGLARQGYPVFLRIRQDLTVGFAHTGLFLPL